MVRIIGGIIIFAAALMIGCKKAGRLKCRRDRLAAFENALNILENEIEYSQNPITAVFENIASIYDGYNNIGSLFADTAKNISKKGIKRAWSDSVLRFADKYAFTDKDAEVIRIMGNDVGMSGVNGQIKSIRYVKGLVHRQYEQAAEEYEKSAKLYISMGALGGAFVVLIFI